MHKSKIIIAVIITFILTLSITVTAALVTSANNITFSSDKTDKTNVNEALDELYTKTDNHEQCPNGFHCLTGSLTNIVNVGDYISMTPTATSYTIDTTTTGYTSEQTITPSELNLWRVIRKNNNGTVEVVSEYVSSTTVLFKGKAGYLNLVGGLNTIAAQYTNSKYVSKTRHIGYSNQTEKLTNSTALSQTTAPWTKNTSIFTQWTGCDTNSYLCGTDEILGAGDIGYETDYSIVNSALGTMLGKTPNGTATKYWLASRQFYFSGSTVWHFNGRFVTTDGGLTINNLYNYYNGFSESAIQCAIRPILTLKADIVIKSGNGKSAATAYELK